jgi:two-component system sensor histidine kinase KdpD
VIGGAASSLADPESRLDEPTRREFAQSIVDEASQMTQLIANVLDMTRLESGRSVTRLEWVSLEEVVGAALHRLQTPLVSHAVSVHLDEAPALSHVSISARRTGDEVELMVADDGPGFATEIDPNALFDKFQRGRAEGAVGGVGLGLAICRAIARAHGGDVRAERIPAGGALFVVTLPLVDQAPEVPQEADA